MYECVLNNVAPLGDRGSEELNRRGLDGAQADGMRKSADGRSWEAAGGGGRRRRWR